MRASRHEKLDKGVIQSAELNVHQIIIGDNPQHLGTNACILWRSSDYHTRCGQRNHLRPDGKGAVAALHSRGGVHALRSLSAHTVKITVRGHRLSADSLTVWEGPVTER